MVAAVAARGLLAGLLLLPTRTDAWLNDITFVVPAKQENPGAVAQTISIDCTFEDPVDVLFLAGHLHELGEAFSVDHSRADGSERIYEVPDWDPYYRDVPPVNEYQVGEYHVAAGDSFTTTCTWTNPTDREVGFPEEMCATYGMAYPTKVPIICTPEPTVLE